MSSHTMKLTYENEDGDEVELVLPAKYEVCGRCEGHGTHLNPSIGQHAYSPEEFNQEFDEDGQREYFRRGGIYDVTCEVCHGRRVVPVVQEDGLTDEQRAEYAVWQKHDEQRARFEAEDRVTMRMESGGWGD